jgi:tripartite-type tricarboxylate transporter receptor subunit TctC
MIDTIAGNVPSMFDSLPSAAPHIKAGKVRALAVSGEQRNPAFPDVPTMKESGFPDLISYSWFGISVPAKTRSRSSTGWRRRCSRAEEPAVVNAGGIGSSTATPAEFTSSGRDRQVGRWSKPAPSRLTKRGDVHGHRRMTSPTPEPRERWSTAWCRRHATCRA